MALYKRGGLFHYDFMVRGKRYRGSTKERSETRARRLEMLRMQEALGNRLTERRAPILIDFAPQFLKWVEDSRLDADTKRYYRNGWRMIEQTRLKGMRLSDITNDDVVAIGPSSGSGCNINNARRTLRRMLSKAVEWRILPFAPKISLEEEHERKVVFSQEQAANLLKVAPQPLKDVATILFDMGLRPEEVFRMRVEFIDWENLQYLVPNGKTKSAYRQVPLSARAVNLLMVRCGGKKEGFVFPSPRSRTGHIVSVEKQWLDTREKLGLDKRYVLYSGRHTFGTDVYNRTGNLKLIMDVMGHSDVKTAMRYQHPAIERIREVIDSRNLEAGDAAEKAN